MSRATALRIARTAILLSIKQDAMGWPSPPARGRGSKPECPPTRIEQLESPPARGRGSKRAVRLEAPPGSGSPPARGRGSKPQCCFGPRRRPRRPLHGGVDRNTSGVVHHEVGLVAPCTGAWIETRVGSPAAGACPSPPARGRGSKHPFAWELPPAIMGRPLHGGVDRNTGPTGLPAVQGGRPLHGGVDRNR